MKLNPTTFISLGISPSSPAIEARSHVQDNGDVQELTVRDILREHALDFDFGEPEHLPEDPFIHAEVEEFMQWLETQCSPPIRWYPRFRPRNGKSTDTRTDPLRIKKDIFNLFHLVQGCVTAGFDLGCERSLRWTTFSAAIKQANAHLIDFDRPGAAFLTDMRNWEAENNLVNSLWFLTHASEYKEKLLLAQIHSQERYASCKAFIDDAFASNPKLSVVRIELGLAPHARGESPLQDIRSHFEIFMQRKRNKEFAPIFEKLVGYLRKLDYKPRTGYHYHLVLLFNGEGSSSDRGLAKAVGKYWVDTVTQGHGAFRECDDLRFGYRSCGIGLISKTDTRQLDLLMKLGIGMLAKIDELCKVAGSTGRRLQMSLVRPRKRARGRRSGVTKRPT